jgi:hypothetical protein
MGLRAQVRGGKTAYFGKGFGAIGAADVEELGDAARRAASGMSAVSCSICGARAHV